ncbi:MAG TPA: plastocyanin/azurin family copper-binding protein [Acidimicrobiales bacterium]
MRRIIGLGALLGLLTTMGLIAPGAQAIHFFEGCTELGSDAGDGDAVVAVQGFAFTDEATGSPVTTISAGESVTWQFADPFCHSVTFEISPDGLDPGEGNANLVKASDEGDNTITVPFEEPGVITYYCSHHWPVGMAGTVIVTP